jgi:hypothetical protein
VINLMNLRFICTYHGYPPGEVIKMRTAGKDFMVIDAEVKNGKEEDLGEQEKREGAKAGARER